VKALIAGVEAQMAPPGSSWLAPLIYKNLQKLLVIQPDNYYNGNKNYIKYLLLLDMQLKKGRVQMFVATRYATEKRSSSNVFKALS